MPFAVFLLIRLFPSMFSLSAPHLSRYCWQFTLIPYLQYYISSLWQPYLFVPPHLFFLRSQRHLPVRPTRGNHLKIISIRSLVKDVLRDPSALRFVWSFWQDVSPVLPEPARLRWVDYPCRSHPRLLPILSRNVVEELNGTVPSREYHSSSLCYLLQLRRSW